MWLLPFAICRKRRFLKQILLSGQQTLKSLQDEFEIRDSEIGMPILDRERGRRRRTKSSSRGIANFQSGKKIRKQLKKVLILFEFFPLRLTYSLNKINS